MTDLTQSAGADRLKKFFSQPAQLTHTSRGFSGASKWMSGLALAAGLAAPGMSQAADLSSALSDAFTRIAVRTVQHTAGNAAWQQIYQSRASSEIKNGASQAVGETINILGGVFQGNQAQGSQPRGLQDVPVIQTGLRADLMGRTADGQLALRVVDENGRSLSRELAQENNLPYRANLDAVQMPLTTAVQWIQVANVQADWVKQRGLDKVAQDQLAQQQRSRELQQDVQRGLPRQASQEVRRTASSSDGLGF